MLIKSSKNVLILISGHRATDPRFLCGDYHVAGNLSADHGDPNPGVLHPDLISGCEAGNRSSNRRGGHVQSMVSLGVADRRLSPDGYRTLGG